MTATVRTYDDPEHADRSKTVVSLALDFDEIDLLIEALEHRASRHEAMARFRPRTARRHDETASAMRNLRNKIRQTPPHVETI